MRRTASFPSRSQPRGDRSFLDPWPLPLLSPWRIFFHPTEMCVHQRESYDVMVAPGDEGVMLVSFSIGADACRNLEGPRIADIPIVYAVDVREWKILSIQK